MFDAPSEWRKGQDPIHIPTHWDKIWTLHIWQMICPQSINQLEKDTHLTFKNGERYKQALHKTGNLNAQKLIKVYTVISQHKFEN